MSGIAALITTGLWLGGIALDPRTHVIAASLLGAVFLFSAIPKLRRPDLAAMALVDFGLVRTAKSRLGRGLGAFEALLGLGLLTGVAAPLPAALSTVALWTFSILLIRALRSGQAISCFCFGGTDPISTKTVMRTIGLAAMSSVVMLLPLQFLAIEDALLSAVVATCILGSLALAAATASAFRAPAVSYGALRP